MSGKSEEFTRNSGDDYPDEPDTEYTERNAETTLMDHVLGDVEEIKEKSGDFRDLPWINEKIDFRNRDPQEQGESKMGRMLSEFKLYHDARALERGITNKEKRDHRDVNAFNLAGSLVEPLDHALTKITGMENYMEQKDNEERGVSYQGPIRDRDQAIHHQLWKAERDIEQDLKEMTWPQLKSGINSLQDTAGDIEILEHRDQMPPDFQEQLERLNPDLAERLFGKEEENKADDWKNGFSKEEAQDIFTSFSNMSDEWSRTRRMELWNEISRAVVTEIRENEFMVARSDDHESIFPNDRERVGGAIKMCAYQGLGDARGYILNGLRLNNEDMFMLGVEQTEKITEMLNGVLQGQDPRGAETYSVEGSRANMKVMDNWKARQERLKGQEPNAFSGLINEMEEIDQL